jgi:hypothetical protein
MDSGHEKADLAGSAPSDSTDAKDSAGNSASAQRARLLAALRVAPLSTIDARAALDVLHPAARVMELRSEGHPIITSWTTAENGDGRPHRVAKYVLSVSGGAR